MRKFRFVGDPEESWLKDLITGEVYPNDYFLTNGGTLISDSRPKECWQELFDEPKPLHNDTDLGMFSAMFAQGLLRTLFEADGSFNYVIPNAIHLAEELIRQLDEKTK